MTEPTTVLSRGEGKTNKPATPKVNLSSLAKEVRDLTKTVGDLAEIVSGLVEKNPETPKVESNAPVVSTSQFPIPVEYREIVNNTLNKKFGIEIGYETPGTFMFSVLVPEEYSNAGKNHWETYREDRRSKVIENALGTNGVQQWTTLVYDNFNPEIKSKIVFDRAQP